MKKLKLILFSIFIGGLITSCANDDDKFSGSPVGVMPIETITGVVSTTATFALPGQTIDFTATLPASFRAVVTDTVTVQATVYMLNGGLRNGSVDILPGQTSATGEINVGGLGPFDMDVQLKLTAINLKTVNPGIHYLLDSNTVTIASGNTNVPSESDTKLKVSFDWENPTTINKLRVKVERVKLTTVTLSSGSAGSAKITVAGINYTAPFVTDYVASAAAFVANNAAAILATSNITVTHIVGTSDMHFAYVTSTIPVITIARTITSNATYLTGTVFSEVSVGSALDVPKSFFFSASKRGAAGESGAYAYTPGDYIFKIGVIQASDLAVAPLDLKYRIVIRYPDGTVEIHNGTYTNLFFGSGFKNVLTVTKNGLGNSTSYSNVLFTP